VGVHHIEGADLLAGFQAEARLDFADEPTDALLARVRAALDTGLHGLGFSAYEAGQDPAAGSQLGEAQVRRRLARIAPHTRWIRTFSCQDGNEIAARVAKEMGLKTLVGAWIGEDAEKNRREIDAVIEVARAGHADLVAVGNEVLLRGEMDEAGLVALIEEVRAAVPGVPVGYVDAYFLFAQRPALVAACDFLPLNCYPFWEGVSLDRSVPYAREMVRRVRMVAGDKPVLIAETGWPTAGVAERGAEPSLRNMALYLLNVLAWTDEAALPLFWFSAFDEAWKVGPEGDCGSFWGLWDAEGGSKIAP
jgi:exo-beta-1,3-glucanase (GH17 family)